MAEFLPFALPDIGEEEINEVVDTIRSGWLTTGPRTRQFEEQFAQLMGGDQYAIAVNSATAGLHLALEAIGIGPGDEVITTAYTFTATAEVIRYLGANPVFLDCNPITLNIDVGKIRAAITPRTRAIIPVHLAGLPCDMHEIIDLAAEYNLRVVEDAAHALPSTYQRKLIGTLDTDVTVFSFYATKTVATGEGGMIVTRDADIAKRCKIMRLHGISRDAFDRYTSDKPSWYYEVVAPGFKYNLTDVASAIGIHQLRRADEMWRKRQAIAMRYDQALKDLPLILPAHAPEGDCHSWHLYMTRLKDDARLSRDEFIKGMFNKGIGCSVHYVPLHLHPYWRDTYHLEPQDFPCAYAAYQQEVSLPIFSRMTPEQTERVAEAVVDLLR